jgi:7 transmembrane receptor (rhodopsin family).
MISTTPNLFDKEIKIVSWFVHTSSIFGAIGNIFILAFFQRLIKKHRGITSYYLWTTLLIATDLTTCLLEALTPLYPAIIVYNDNNVKAWVLLRNIICASVSVSFWTLTGLSYDRYRAITQPFRYKTSLKRIYAMYISFVVVAFVVKYFSMFFEEDGANSISTMVVSYVVCESVFPITFITFFYIKIEKALILEAAPVVPNHLREQRNKRALRMCKRLIQTFILCVIPCRTVALLIKCLLKFTYIQPSEVRMHLEICLLYTSAFLNLHSCVNILVYGVQMSAFRRFIRESVTCRLITKKKVNSRIYLQSKTLSSQ